jgi:hypothetical protein
VPCRFHSYTLLPHSLRPPRQGVAGSHPATQGFSREPDISCCQCLDDDLRLSALLLHSALRTDAPARIDSASLCAGLPTSAASHGGSIAAGTAGSESMRGGPPPS